MSDVSPGPADHRAASPGAGSSDAAEYIQRMCHELKMIAAQAGLKDLAFLLGIAEDESETVGAKIKEKQLEDDYRPFKP